MLKQLPKGVRQVCFREIKGQAGEIMQHISHENRTSTDEAGHPGGICVLESESTDIFENLTIEEELVRQAEQRTLRIFFWRNEDCVVIGRHQDPEAECHMETVEKLGVKVVRRRTGGGAVFQDMGNLNVSFIATADRLDEALCEQILLQALEKCGVQARKTGRNDLVLDDAAEGAGKFSGSASWETPEGHFLFHATLMFDVDLERMKAVLNAPPQKLARHKIASVRSRVANLLEYYPDLTMQTLMRGITAAASSIWTDAV